MPIAYVPLIVSFLIVWIETWFLDFKVLPQEQTCREAWGKYFLPLSLDRNSLAFVALLFIYCFLLVVISIEFYYCLKANYCDHILKHFL